MPTPRQVALIALSLVFVGGCCRDTIREMASIKDGTLKPQPQRSATAAPAAEKPVKAAETVRDDQDASPIETGSIAKKPDCQGAHIAYQATKEYLKNFGPRPPDQPGEQGACNPAAQ